MAERYLNSGGSKLHVLDEGGYETACGLTVKADNELLTNEVEAEVKEKDLCDNCKKVRGERPTVVTDDEE